VYVWLQDTVAHAAAAAHALLYRSLRLKGDAMEAVLGWLAAVAHANSVKTTVTQLNPLPGGASTAFMLGFSATCLRFCHPFLVRVRGESSLFVLRIMPAQGYTHQRIGVVRRMFRWLKLSEKRDERRSGPLDAFTRESRAARTENHFQKLT